MNFSVLAFLEPACSTSSRIFDTVDSSNLLETSILMTPFVFMQPLKALSPFESSAGTASPVKAEVSTTALPSQTTPSKGIFSPVFTTIISPIATFSGETFSILPSFSRFAKSGLMSISAVIEALDFSTALS